VCKKDYNTISSSEGGLVSQDEINRAMGEGHLRQVMKLQGRPAPEQI
jgi:hypothetical protein